MPDFEELKKQQNTSLKDTITFSTKNVQKAEAVRYDDEFIENQLDEQRDFYRDYKQKWKREHEGKKVYQSELANPMEIKVSNENLSYLERVRRRSEAKANKAVWENKLGSIPGVNKYYGLSLSNKADTYANDLMLGTLKHVNTELKKREIQGEILQGEESELFTKYKDEILALAPQIKIHMDSISGEAQFDEESVNCYRAYLEKAAENPVEVLKNSISDTINSMGNLSPKLLSRHAIPQFFDTIKDYRDRYKAIDSLMKKRSLKDDENNEVCKMLKDLYEKKDKNGKKVDEANYELASTLYKSIDADLRYSLNHYGINFKDNGSLVDKFDEKRVAYNKTNGDLAQLVMQKQFDRQTKSKHRITSAYWREQARKAIGQDNVDEKKRTTKAGDTENKILSALGAFEKRKARIDKDKNRKMVFERMTANAAKIASAISEIDKELKDSEDVFERRAEEFKLRPEYKRQVQIYIEKRKQEQLDLIDRAGGYIDALKSLVLNEDFTALGKRILLDNQMSEKEIKIEYETGEDNLFSKKEVSSDDFIVIDDINVKQRKGSVVDTLSKVVYKTYNYADIKKRLFDKLSKSIDDEDELEVGMIMGAINDVKGPMLISMFKAAGLDILEMEPQAISAKIIEFSDDANIVTPLKKAVVETYKGIDEKYDNFITPDYLEFLGEDGLNDLIKETGELCDRFLAVKRIMKEKSTILDPFIDAKDRVRFTELSKLAEMKFKIIRDKLYEYRYTKLIERIEVGDTEKSIFTDDELDYIEKNKDKLKGKSMEQFLVELFNRKREALRVSRSAHVKELNICNAEILAKQALKDEDAFVTKRKRKAAGKDVPKNIDEIILVKEELEDDSENNEDDDQSLDESILTKKSRKTESSKDDDDDENDDEEEINTEKEEEKQEKDEEEEKKDEEEEKKDEEEEKKEEEEEKDEKEEKEEKEEEKEEKEEKDERELIREQIRKEHEEEIKSIKESLQKYKTEAKNFSLLDRNNRNQKLMSYQYNDATTQKETLSCWAASHSYVMRMYVKQHRKEFVANKTKFGLPSLPSFHESHFKTMENYKPNPLVEGKIEETKNQEKAEINYYKESENIKDFLSSNRMGNPFTVADTVITRLPRTAERHVVFALRDYKDLQFDKQEQENLGNYVMKKLSDDIFRTRVPVSLLHAAHYYSVVGVNMNGRYLECLDSRKKGNELKKPVHVPIDEIISSKKFEIIYPEYLDEQNLNKIKEEFGIKDNLYDQQGQMVEDEELTRIKQIQLDNPVNMMHNHGVSFEKKKEKQQEPFEKLFSEEIYMPNNLNLPLIIKNEGIKKRNKNS